MSKLAKIIVTIIIVVIFVALTAVINGSRDAAGYSTPGIWGIIVLVGAIGGIRAVWKKPKENSD